MKKKQIRCLAQEKVKKANSRSYSRVFEVIATLLLYQPFFFVQSMPSHAQLNLKENLFIQIEGSFQI